MGTIPVPLLGTSQICHLKFHGVIFCAIGVVLLGLDPHAIQDVALKFLLNTRKTLNPEPQTFQFRA